MNISDNVFNNFTSSLRLFEIKQTGSKMNVTFNNNTFNNSNLVSVYDLKDGNEGIWFKENGTNYTGNTFNN